MEDSLVTTTSPRRDNGKTSRPLSLVETVVAPAADPEVPELLPEKDAVAAAATAANTSSTGHHWPQRPRTLTSQLFASLDSEQSIPRTAPLATPEHDTSLVDLASMDSSNNNRGQKQKDQHQLMEQQQSLDGFTNDVFNEESESSNSSSSGQKNPRMSDIRRANLMRMRQQQHQESGDGCMDSHHTSVDVNTAIFDEADPGAAVLPDTMTAEQLQETPGDGEALSNNNHRHRHHVFSFNLDSPNQMEEDDVVGALLSRGGGGPSESSAPITIDYLSAPGNYSDGLTPSPMSISEVVSEDRQTPSMANQEDEEQDRADMYSPANSVFNSPTHELGDEGDNAVGFTIEITPPPNSVHFTHELPDVRINEAAANFPRSPPSTSPKSSSAGAGGNIDMDFHDPSVEDRRRRLSSSSDTGGSLQQNPEAVVMRPTHHTRQGYPMCPGECDSSEQQQSSLSAAAAAEPESCDGASGGGGEGAASEEVVITKLPSIPQRSTFRVTLPPDEVLPPRKLTNMTYLIAHGGLNSRQKTHAYLKCLHIIVQTRDHLKKDFIFYLFFGGGSMKLHFSQYYTTILMLGALFLM
jgi:hypothetical protein